MSTVDEVEEFAALLRRLKDRTDRSYGSLARRLAMNTSTLHRYCAGEAVPQEYAPVERLAAFCAATPEERLELHRLWLRAVAARQRPQPGEKPAHAMGATDASKASDAAGVTDATEALTTAGGAGRDGSVGASWAEVAAVEEAKEEERNAGRGDREPPRASAPAPARPWYRRRPALVGAAAAAVLLVTLGSLAALPADGTKGGSGSAGGPARSRTTEARASQHPSAPASGPSPGRSSASPSAGGRASARPTPEDAPSATAKGGAPAVTGVPLAWTADSQVWNMGCGHDYVVDKPPAQVPPPPVQQDAGAWAATQRAVHGRQTMVQISVQGRSSTAVVLEALRVRIVSRGTPAAGSAYAMDQGCGGELTPRSFTVNLDADRPTARPKDGADSEHTIPAVHFPYRVSAEDPEVLLVDATTDTYDARWYLELDWSCQGRTGTVRIDDHGRPFRTSGIQGKPRYWYGTDDSGERAWVPYGN
ncbi:helix-turn-helix domain-containing protein [Streptomyces sp. 7R007]